MATSEAQKRATRKYQARTQVELNLKMNKETEQDIIDWLNRQESKRGAVKALIRKEIKREEITQRDLT